MGKDVLGLFWRQKSPISDLWKIFDLATPLHSLLHPPTRSVTERAPSGYCHPPLPPHFPSPPSRYPTKCHPHNCVVTPVSNDATVKTEAWQLQEINSLEPEWLSGCEKRRRENYEYNRFIPIISNHTTSFTIWHRYQNPEQPLGGEYGL